MSPNKQSTAYSLFQQVQPAPNNILKNVVLPMSLYRSFAASSKLIESLGELDIITIPILQLWAKANRNVISETTCNVFINDCIHDNLLEAKADGTYRKTSHWKRLYNVKHEALANIKSLEFKSP